MLKINTEQDLQIVRDLPIYSYLHDLLLFLLDIYCRDCEIRSIEPFGAIYVAESAKDLQNYQAMQLSSPLTEKRFEWISDIGNNYANGCIILDNDTAINIVSSKENYRKAGIIDEQYQFN